MKDYITIGATPYEESCAQLGREDYYEQSRLEGKRYIKLLLEKFGPEPEGAYLKLKGFPHDFGTYYEVVCCFDDTLPRSVEYAYFLEGNSPATWDDNAKVDWREGK